MSKCGKNKSDNDVRANHSASVGGTLPEFSAQHANWPVPQEMHHLHGNSEEISITEAETHQSAGSCAVISNTAVETPVKRAFGNVLALNLPP